MTTAAAAAAPSLVLNHARVAVGGAMPLCGDEYGRPCHYELAPGAAGDDFTLDVWWWAPAEAEVANPSPNPGGPVPAI